MRASPRISFLVGGRMTYPPIRPGNGLITTLNFFNFFLLVFCKTFWVRITLSHLVKKKSISNHIFFLTCSICSFMLNIHTQWTLHTTYCTSPCMCCLPKWSPHCRHCSSEIIPHNGFVPTIGFPTARDISRRLFALKLNLLFQTRQCLCFLNLLGFFASEGESSNWPIHWSGSNISRVTYFLGTQAYFTYHIYKLYSSVFVLLCFLLELPALISV